MRQLKLVFVKIGVCLCLYCFATIWHFSRREYSANSLLTELEYAPITDAAKEIEQNAPPLTALCQQIPKNGYKEQPQPEKRKSSSSKIRLLFVKEEEKH